MFKSHKKIDYIIDEKTKFLLIQRDRLFLKELFESLNPYLLRVCNSLGIHKQDAEDIVFSAWETFFNKIDQFEGRSQIRTFVCGILFNKVRDFKRGQKRFDLKEDSETVYAEIFSHQGWWNIEPSDPYKLLKLKQSKNQIHDCLEGLTMDQKAAFLLREIEDESTENICQTLQVSLENVRLLIFRAKDKLRKCMEGKASAW
jgi:RNA polymerase sigma-70 factor, ECF subfamily